MSKCAFCGKGEGSIPITDGETLREIWICEDCDNEMNKRNVEGFIIEIIELCNKNFPPKKSEIKRVINDWKEVELIIR